MTLHNTVSTDPPTTTPVLSQLSAQNRQKNKTVEFFHHICTFLRFCRNFSGSFKQPAFLSVCCSMQISWWRLRSLVDSKKNPGNKETLTFPGERNHALVPGLTPFSEYSLIVMTFNGRGNGPGSHPVNFKTPQGGRIVGKQHKAY